MQVNRRFYSREQATAYAQRRASSSPGQTYYVLQTTLGQIIVSNDSWGWQVLSSHVAEKYGEDT